jgi:hypothetical protein
VSEFSLQLGQATASALACHVNSTTLPTHALVVNLTFNSSEPLPLLRRFQIKRNYVCLLNNFLAIYEDPEFNELLQEQSLRVYLQGRKEFGAQFAGVGYIACVVDRDSISSGDLPLTLHTFHIRPIAFDKMHTELPTAHWEATLEEAVRSLD